MSRKTKENKSKVAIEDVGLITNRLDSKLVAESKLPKRKKRKLIFISVFAVAIAATAGSYLVISRRNPEPAKQLQPEDPFNGREPDWGQYFHYKTKDQR